jgi:hypothetical protein
MEHSELRARRPAPPAGSRGPTLTITMRPSTAPELYVGAPLGSSSGGSGGTTPSNMSSTAAPAPTAAGSTIGSASKPTLAAVPIDMKRWLPDESIAVCCAPECRQPFTLLKRKHHCRTCGYIFCSNCWSRNICADDGSNMRVCNGCYHQHQLVVSQTRANGRQRRRCRGELKLMPSRLLVNVVSFLDLNSIAKTALVSGDFYFVCRDNALWDLQFRFRFANNAADARTVPRNLMPMLLPAAQVRPGHRRTMSMPEMPRSGSASPMPPPRGSPGPGTIMGARSPTPTFESAPTAAGMNRTVSFTQGTAGGNDQQNPSIASAPTVMGSGSYVGAFPNPAGPMARASGNSDGPAPNTGSATA